MKKIKKESGIYSIKNIINNKYYIGQSKNIHVRFNNHKHCLRKNKHSNPYLQEDFNIHCEINFKFEILELCSIEQLLKREKYYLTTIKECYNLQNVEDIINHPKRKYCKKTALKISNALKGKIPKNLDSLQKAKRKKVAYYLDNVLVKIFDSCIIGAEYFNVKPNIFNLYIGRQYKNNKIRKSKHFGINYKLEYYEE
jgi:predicted GIY-YIG superfamily endonuclease